MVTMTDQCTEGRNLVVSQNDVNVSASRKPFALSASDYNAITIDGPDSKKKSNNNALFCKSAPLRRRHRSINNSSGYTQQALKRDIPARMPSFDTPDDPNCAKPPRPSPLFRYNSERRHTRPPSGKRSSEIIQQTNSDKADLHDGWSLTDSVSVISIENNIEERTESESKSYCEYLDCNEKLQKEVTAILKLRKLIRGSDCICNTTKGIIKGSLYLCGWGTPRPSSEFCAKSSTSKKRTSSTMFNRLVHDGREKSFYFSHYTDSSQYMSQYRNEHTVQFTGNISRAVQVIGRDVPDPYITKPINVCLVTELSSFTSSSSLAGAKKMTDANCRRGCPDLSPVRPMQSPSSQEMGKTTPSQHIISVNEFMDAYLPQPSLPNISNRTECSSGQKVQNTGTCSVSSSTQFDGEIVGIKHRLPTTTTYNLSALCKPCVGTKVYDDFKSPSNSYRTRPRAKKLESKSKSESQLVSVVSSVTSKDVPSSCAATVPTQKTHSDTGCRGCNRITSLIRANRKNTRHDTKQKQTFGQCKPLDDQSLNLHYRLQKMPIG